MSAIRHSKQNIESKTYLIEQAQQNVPDPVDIKDRYMSERAAAATQKTESLAHVERQYSITDAYEVFQWGFDKDNQPSLTYTGMGLTKENNEELSQNLKFDTAFDLVLEDRISHINQHLPMKLYLAMGLKLRD